MSKSDTNKVIIKDGLKMELKERVYFSYTNIKERLD